MDEREAARLFAELREGTPAPGESELRALAGAASSRSRSAGDGDMAVARWGRGPRLAAVAIAVALLLGSGLGFGLASSLTPTGSARPSVAGVGFLPAREWTVLQSGTFDVSGKASAIAANVALDPRDGLGGVPRATVRSLRGNGVVIYVTFATRGDPAVDVAFPARELPLELAAATRVPSGEYRLRAGVGGYNVDARLYFGSPRPSARMLGSAQRQLSRLVVASERVTIFVRPTVVEALGYYTLFGSVDSGRADEVVDVEARECGSSSAFFLGVAAVRTEDGGAWSLRRFAPRVTTAFRAVWNGEASAQVTVRRRAEVRLRRLGTGRRFEVFVGGRQFWRKHVLVQRFDRRLGTWTTVRKVVLRDQGTGPGASAVFTLRVSAGTRVRAVVPSSQARPCYESGTSAPFLIG
jgi:hypothetical protein